MTIKSILISVIVLVAVVFITRWAVTHYTPTANFLYDGGETLAQCPDSPNCVSSTFTDDRHYITAIAGDRADFAILKRTVADEDSASVISETDEYLHAEFRSKWLNFVDDVQLLHRDGSSEIQVRSASRLGKSDFGVNKKRIQALVAKLQQEK